MYAFFMRTKILSFLLPLILLIPTGSAHASQIQENLEGTTRKLALILQEKASLLETLADLELSADIATDEKNTKELQSIKDLVTALIEKQEVLDKVLPSLKKSLDEDCVEARKDKSDTADAIDTIGACEDAESVYVASENSSKSFKESLGNIEANFGKFGLTLAKPTPTPTPSQAAKPSPAPSQSTQTASVTSKKPITPTKSTITCIKGKQVKKITAAKPKCPAGYKLKK